MFLEFSTFKWNSWEIKVWNSDASVALRKYIHDKSSQRELDVGATNYPLGKCGFSFLKENCEMALMLSLSALTQRQFIFLTENHFNKIIMFLSNILETFGHLVQSENCWPDLNMFPQQKFDNIISLDSAQPRELKYFSPWNSWRAHDTTRTEHRSTPPGRRRSCWRWWRPPLSDHCQQSVIVYFYNLEDHRTMRLTLLIPMLWQLWTLLSMCLYKSKLLW